ncbi:MAG TPA: hypothetical protein VHL09_04735 [Dehalococcoidia bacterium]|nr:hypothetical protein [Dehalococcoidia bacterium]
MWRYIRTVPNVVAAQMWKDLFEAEGLPCRIEPIRAQAHLGGRATYRVMCAVNKEHIADDIMNNAFILADTSGQVAKRFAYIGQGRAPAGPALPDRGSASLPGSAGDPFGEGIRPRTEIEREPQP